jgi:hypothetical protein
MRQLPVALASLVVLASLLALSVPSVPTMGDSRDDEISRLSSELNATRAEVATLSAQLNSTTAKLDHAKSDRDAYAVRLEEGTYILVIALVLLGISWAVFWLSNRRQALMLREMAARGELPSPPRRPRRRG